MPPKKVKVPPIEVPSVVETNPTPEPTTPTVQPASLLPIGTQRQQNVTVLGLATLCFTIATGLITTGQYIPGAIIGALGVSAFYVYERFG